MSTITGYNDSPPADDGTKTAANKVTYASITTNLTDPIKDFVEENLPIKGQSNAAPTVTDDVNKGYEPLSTIIDTAAGVAYICTDNTAGAAVWQGIGVSDVVSDTTPQLGGDLDTNGQSIVTTSNADVVVNPNGTGVISVSGTTDYENNVTDDDDIPNKKYVDDRNITLGTEDTTTGGTSISFSIPTGTKRIKVWGETFSTNGSSIPLIQIGDSGGFETSGYSGRTVNQTGSASVAWSSGASLFTSIAAGTSYQLCAELELKDPVNNTWGIKVKSQAISAASHGTGVGFKSLSAELTDIRIIMTNGTDTIDVNNGINIQYE